MGCGRMSDPNLVRHAYDRGVNFFDTSETYVNGDSERAIGQAMPHLQRERVFVVTKLRVEREESEQSIVDRFRRSLGRLRTAYVDGLYMHGVTEAAMVKHAGFHAAIRRLKAEGKVRHAGISSHGPRGAAGDAMDRVLLAAAEDGRFDLMLLVYSFINREPGQRVLAACKRRGIGATLMKVTPARLELKPFDPDDPSEEHARMIGLLIKRGLTREQAVAQLKVRLEQHRADLQQNRATIDAFVARYGIRTEEQLAENSVRWALGNPAVSTVLVSMNDFETIDAFTALAGTRLTGADSRRLRDWNVTFGRGYCRHGCAACAGLCPHGVPVSTVMRYAYYFARQGRQRHAMERYAALDGLDGARCLDCDAPCRGACPYGFAIQAQLMTAHQLLSLA